GYLKRPPNHCNRGLASLGQFTFEQSNVRGQVHAAVVVLGGSCGREVHAAAATQYVVVAARTAVLIGGGKWVEILARAGSAPSASDRHGGAEVLAVCGKWRATAAVRGRAAKATRRSRACRRYGC